MLKSSTELLKLEHKQMSLSETVNYEFQSGKKLHTNVQNLACRNNYVITGIAYVIATFVRNLENKVG